MSSGFFHHNSLDRSISKSRVSGKFLLLLCFLILNANSTDPDQTPRSAVVYTSSAENYVKSVFPRGLTDFLSLRPRGYKTLFKLICA